jgi:hypothetical protein
MYVSTQRAAEWQGRGVFKHAAAYCKILFPARHAAAAKGRRPIRHSRESQAERW